MLSAGFGSQLAWLADREQEIVFVGRDDDDGRHAGRLAVAVGIRRLAGFLHGGMTSWRQEKRAGRPDRAPAARRPAARTPTSVQILDVREQSEWDAGHIPGSVVHAVARHRRRCPRASTPTARSPSSARRASAPRSAASLLQRLGAAASTSSTAACRPGAASGHPLER